MDMNNMVLEPGDCAIILHNNGAIQTVIPSIGSADEITPAIHTAHMVFYMLQNPEVFNYVRNSFFQSYGNKSMFNLTESKKEYKLATRLLIN